MLSAVEWGRLHDDNFLLQEIDFNLCLLSQKNTGEKLQCPSEHTNLYSDFSAGYDTLIKNMTEFKVHEVITCISKYIEVDNLSNVLFRNKGKWHKKCWLLYNETKLTCLQQKAFKRTES